MTLSQYQSRARLLLQQGVGSMMDGEPFMTEPLLFQAADAVAKATDCHWREVTLDMVADQSKYCAPPIYKLKAVYGTDNTGAGYRLALTTRNRTDYRYDAFGSTPALNPSRGIVEGMNRLILSPVASEDRTGGLRFAGFAVPCGSDTESPLNQWRVTDEEPDPECPICQEGQQAVLYQYILLRITQMMASENDKIAEIAMRLEPRYTALYNQEIGLLESFAAKRYSDMQRGTLTG